MLVSWIELPQSEIHPLSNWREREIETRSIYMAITAVVSIPQPMLCSFRDVRGKVSRRIRAN